MHAHNVFFKLKDNAPDKVAHFIADSKQYLAILPGIVSFECGLREGKCDREVNDLDFDVSLHVLFESLDAHDAYQVADSHNEYVKRNQGNWAAARVFDTTLK